MVIKRWAAAPVAGVLLGSVDFVWIKYVPFPFGGLGNSIATWAVAAFLVTCLAGWGPFAAVVMLVVAVPSYYVAAFLIQHDDLANVLATTSLIWMGLGVVAGLVFGAGGVLARRPGLLRLPALALPAAILLAEAVIGLARLGNPDYGRAEEIAYATLLLILALAVTALVARNWRDRLLALGWTVPLTAAGWSLLTITGFG